MSSYLLTWITKNLAVGHAPMSYEELENIKEQGINAIVNLCGEFSDLTEIEESAGFEVFWLPVPDETAPNMEEMEKGLEWLDDAIYLDKKVLVHCRHGIGRTGTFVTAYLLRRGFDLKNAGKMLKTTRANPTNFSQWWLLRKFGKKEGKLTIGEPTPDNRNREDLSEFYKRYEVLLEKINGLNYHLSSDCCEKTDNQPCSHAFTLELIEALYLNNKVNSGLPGDIRQKVIAKAINGTEAMELTSAVSLTGSNCPLHHDNTCLLHQFRPVHCRLKNFNPDDPLITEFLHELGKLSQDTFMTLFQPQAGLTPPAVSLSETVSGKFIQRYFDYLMSQSVSHEK